VCTGCGAIGTAYRLADLSWWCPTCDTRTSVTAGTIFHRTRTPLTLWFAAAWFLTSQKDGASALGLQRVLGLGSYQTAWAMLHRLRSAMVRPGRDMLSGDVEVDETSIGGVKPGKRGRGAACKTLVAVAVERTGAKGFGRCRLLVIPDATAPTLGQFLADHVEPGSVVLTDGLKSYPIAIGANYVHKPVNLAGTGLPAHVPLPGVHRIASLVKRWLLSTHQGAVEGDHLQAYLDEFCFRFNRRTARSRGLLFRRLLEQSGRHRPENLRTARGEPTRSDGHAARSSGSGADRQAGRPGVAGHAGPGASLEALTCDTALRWIPHLYLARNS
jgi:transposase-like protein